ncbi:MAG: response regulator [Kiritimatiellae bacterium]|nr:response regulator [Kiritimatiellia bacterium]MDD5522719.1 response regulator [Kiritimatiellia bacterium]
MENKIILLVEDNPDDVDLTLRAFKKNNIANSVVIKRDGAEALEYLFGTENQSPQECNPLPAIILLDIKLPKIDGIEVLKRLRANPRTKILPVIILTSSTQEQDIIDSYSFGANSYVRKPVDFDQFIEAVRQLGLYWLLLNELPPAGK